MDPLLIILIGTATVLICIIKLKLHAAVSLLFAALITALLTSPEQIMAFATYQEMGEKEAQALMNMSLGKRLASAFGNTSGKIGILIALASIIGAGLMRSGGAEKIIRALLKLFGKKNTSVALLSGSFALAIPVFFDTVFYLMIPLVKAVGVRNPKKFGLYLMTIIAGGVMAHSLIPPTPGPLFVAEEMGIDLGAMIIGGLCVGAITVICGYIYAIWANKRWDLPMRDTPEMKIDDLKQFSEKTSEELPSLWLSLLPVLLPILLITGNTFSRMALDSAGNQASDLQRQIASIFSTLGDANIALFISTIIVLYLLWKRLKDMVLFKKFIYEALSGAGMIILITSAGGAFGQMLQQTGIGIRVGELAANYQMAILPLAFFITAGVRTAQGSATVAMVTAIGVIGSIGQADLAFHPVYLALAIGCGSKIFAWMNDSAFWIITKMSGMEEKETIRFFSILLMVMGFSGLFAVMILSKLLPFV
ncbi:GntP family permease [Aurantibacter crassamenti]|uniref:GntP family permease n=1 Tax=Aurantibacter crassamenti TaxID=1837375 RepID=UPI00193A4649|nr:GntP family permease [Aurantibacter crassamenti]MBM1105837.1 GntP family permease [Aurantibacter crassamenti]